MKIRVKINEISKSTYKLVDLGDAIRFVLRDRKFGVLQPVYKKEAGFAMSETKEVWSIYSPIFDVDEVLQMPNGTHRVLISADVVNVVENKVQYPLSKYRYCTLERIHAGLKGIQLEYHVTSSISLEAKSVPFVPNEVDTSYEEEWIPEFAWQALPGGQV